MLTNEIPPHFATRPPHLSPFSRPPTTLLRFSSPRPPHLIITRRRLTTSHHFWLHPRQPLTRFRHHWPLFRHKLALVHHKRLRPCLPLLILCPFLTFSHHQRPFCVPQHHCRSLRPGCQWIRFTTNLLVHHSTTSAPAPHHQRRPRRTPSSLGPFLLHLWTRRSFPDFTFLFTAGGGKSLTTPNQLRAALLSILSFRRSPPPPLRRRRSPRHRRS